MVDLPHRLRVFISSTADLAQYRDTAELTLRELCIEGSRFETWPSVPVPLGGLAECRRRIQESEAVVLILGSKYGTIAEGGLSATHVEYRHALDLRRPTFCFLLQHDECDSRQADFIEEVQNSFFRGPRIGSVEELAVQLKRAFLNEFTRCFRDVHGGPPVQIPEPSLPSQSITATRELLVLSDDRDVAEKQLLELYQGRDDDAIRQLSPQILLRFRGDPRIINLLYMSEVNLGMNHHSPHVEMLEAAISFWGDADLSKVFTKYSMDFNRGNAFTALGRHDEAIAAYNEALQDCPGYAQCWKNLATSFIHLGNREAAKAHLSTAIKCDPSLWEARYSLAAFALEDRAYDVALAHLDAIDEPALSSEQRSWISGYRARAYHERGDLGSAVSAIERAIALSPKDEWPWLWAARIYAIARRNDEAWLDESRRYGERFVSRFPSAGDGWGELGLVYWQMRLRKDDADVTQKCKYALAKAVDLGFLDGGLIPDRLGHIESEDGNVDAAERCFRVAAEEDGGQFGYCLGFCLLQQEKYEEAIPWLDAAARVHQPDGTSWSNLACCYERSGNRSKAIECYERAIEADPDYGNAWFNLGGALWNSRDREAATRVWQEALLRFPDHELGSRARALLTLLR